MYTLADRSFDTKKAIEARCQTLLEGLVPEDAPMLLALIDWHPNADHILGCGPRSLYVHEGPTGPTFALERVDGSTIDWNYKTAVKGPSRLQAARAFFRQLVQPHLHAFKADAFSRFDLFRCPNGGFVCKWEAEVGYEAPQTFNGLVKAFLVERDLEIGDDLEPSAPAFIEFHVKHARLEICNPPVREQPKAIFVHPPVIEEDPCSRSPSSPATSTSFSNAA